MNIGSKVKENFIWMVVGGIIIISIIAGGAYNAFFSPSRNTPPEIPSDDPLLNFPGNNTNQNNSIPIPPESETTPNMSGEITIDGIGTFTYNPRDIVTVRPDIFKPGHFSIFDILVWLDNTSQIYMDYYFNESVNSHIIRSLAGRTNFWYSAYYSGGWPERNVFRMDHFPVKDDTTIILFHKDEQEINDIYSTWIEEVERKQSNSGKIVIPRVQIEHKTEHLIFRNVTVTAHNLRSDMFQPGIITAIDTLLSLADQYVNFSVGLQWYESIGRAEIVKNYWVERINSWQAENTCGFVYEAGDEDYNFFQGNHIHIPSDIRIINSPQYVEYFWICL